MLARLLGILKRFRREEGATLAEYTLILAFILLAVAVSMGALGVALSGFFEGFVPAFG